MMLEMVQQASLRMPSLGEDSKLRRAGRAPDVMMTWVCRSSPVTMLPTERRAGVWTAVEGCLKARSVRSACERKQKGWNAHQQVNQTPAHAALDNGLNLVVGTIRQI